MRKNIQKNKGITLIILIITIVIALVILSVTIVAVKSSKDNSYLIAYAKDLSAIEDATSQYYISNASFPTEVEGEASISQTTLLTNVPVANQEYLINELKDNGDHNENGDLGSFYIIDLKKLNVAESMKGIKKDGDQSDVFVIAYPSMNIYYLKGLKVKGKYYYSLSPKLTNITKIKKEDNISDVQTVAGITTKRVTKSWTNNLGVTVQAVIDAGETLVVKISNGEERQINVVNGINTFSFDTLAELKLKAPTITDAEVNSLDNSSIQSSKYIEIIKKNNTTVVGSIKLDLSNYERVSPVKDTEPAINSQLDTNIVTFKSTDATSGVKEVRYEYLNVFNKNGNIENYYNGVTELDENYMKSRAKKGTITKEGNIELKIPKDVEGIQILIVDKAGNWTNIIEPMYSGNRFYVGIIPKEISLTKATFKLVFNSRFGISNAVTYLSSDGITYANPKAFTINQNDLVSFKNVDDYVGLEGFSEKIYLKVLATDNNAEVDSRVQEQRVFELTKADNNQMGTREKNASKWNKPYIPTGFDYIEGSVEDGFVIQDVTNNAQTNGNEFVWIPIKDTADLKRYKAAYNATTSLQIDWLDLSSSTEFMEKETSAEYVSMKNSILKYGGFYIARYEAGISKKMTQAKLSADTTAKYGSGEYRPVSRKDTPVWNYIAWGGVSTDVSTTDGGPGNDLSNGAVKVARSMYPNISKLATYALPTSLTNYTDVVSTLCYDVQWDATMKYLQDVKNMYQQNRPYVVNSMYMGNFEDGDTTNDPALTGDKTYTQYVTKNIYDLAGNVAERTMGYSNENGRNFRGGYFRNYDDITLYNNATSRDSTTTQDSSANFGFRVALYIN